MCFRGWFLEFTAFRVKGSYALGFECLAFLGLWIFVCCAECGC